MNTPRVHKVPTVDAKLCIADPKPWMARPILSDPAFISSERLAWVLSPDLYIGRRLLLNLILPTPIITSYNG